MSDVINAVKEVAKELTKEQYIKEEELEKVLMQDKEWFVFWALKGILSGLNAKELDQLLKPDNGADDMFRLYTVSMAEEYKKYDGLIQEIDAAKSEVNDALAEYEELKETVLNELRGSIESEREAWHKQLDGKDEFIRMMQEDHDRVLEEKKKAEELIQDLEKQLAEVNKMRDQMEKNNEDLRKQLKSAESEREETEKKHKEEIARTIVIPKKQGFFERIFGKKRDLGLEQFVSKILTDKKCDTAHQEFYIECLEEGYSVVEIERYLYHPDASVDALVRIRDYYTKNIRH